MKRILTLTGIVVAGGLATATAQTYQEWDDVSVTHLNRERAHTLGIPLADASAVSKS